MQGHGVADDGAELEVFVEVVPTGNRVVVDRDDDVAAGKEAAVADDDLALGTLETGGEGGAVTVKLGDEDAALDGELKGAGQAGGDVVAEEAEPGVRVVALRDESGHDALQGVDGDGEADTLGVLADGGGDADDATAAVEQGGRRCCRS